MWRFFACFFCFASAMEEYSPPYFCSDMKPQPTIHVPQLMGMWYVVEKINHQDERHYVRTVNSCPVIHISEDQPPSTVNPLYNNNRRYGQGYGYNTGVPSNYGYNQGNLNQERDHQHRLEYDRNPSGRKLYEDKWNPNSAKRFLRVFWDEIESIEHHVWYNFTTPGFWISRGPENGAALKTQFSHYAGNIQVLKAVGNHMVLLFCYRLPEPQLFSVIMARETQLSPVEIHSVHRMLNRKGLKTNAVEKLCKNGDFRLFSSHSLVLFSFFIYNILK